MGSYKPLSKQEYSIGDYAIVPVRIEDKYKIMKWRNDQIYHLRQSKPLTKNDQDDYFENVVMNLFEDDQPDQVLFSYLEKSSCIGYGGLVHINWNDKNSEISFVLDSSVEELYFEKHWVIYLKLIEKVAFGQLDLHKIYTYAFDLRPRLYDALEEAGFNKEATLKDHCYINNRYLDVVFHSKINPFHGLESRPARIEDAKILFDWANKADVRRSALNSAPINWEDHLQWLQRKIDSNESIITIFLYKDEPLGQVRLDFEHGFWFVDYSIDEKFRGKGFGKVLISKSVEKSSKKVRAIVRKNNYYSIRVFESLGFKEVPNSEEGLREFTYAES